MIKNMYGSIHTHFEDSFDAVNDFSDAILQFILQGSVKVAATGHGVFSEYEDIRDALSEARAKADEVRFCLKDLGVDVDHVLINEPDGRISVHPLLQAENVTDDDIKDYVRSIGVTGHLSQERKDQLSEKYQESLSDEEQKKLRYLALSYIAMVEQFDVIPGVEAYFEDEKSHMILIAKDYEGYQSISKIITQSNLDYHNDAPITTLENLKENVSKGHVLCTSACIGGLGLRLSLNKFNLETRVHNLEQKLEEAGFQDALDCIDERDELKKVKKPTKAARQAAERLLKKEGNSLKIKEWDQQMADYEQAQEDLNAPAFVERVAQSEKIIKANSRSNTSLEKYRSQLDDALAHENEEKEYVLSTYRALEDIFGKENYYFELQNHGLEAESVVYNDIINLAYEVNNPHFVASNDVHICITKDDPNYENALVKRNVAQFGRFKKYFPMSDDDREYVIKSDEELRSKLLELVSSKSHSNIRIDESKNEIVDQAINNIQGMLSQCHVEHPKNQEHYPKLSDDENQLFDDLVEQGARRLFPNGLPTEYRERLDYEKRIIKEMGYAGYHLIVQDYLAYGRLLGYLNEDEIADAPLSIEELEAYVNERHPDHLGLGIGPGRGSAAGSLACYFLGITNIDPIKRGLLFERFLNVERISMPDIDSDFKTDIRDKCYEYCKQKYGEDCVCKVMTKTYLALKGAFEKSAGYLTSKDAVERGLTSNDSEVSKKYQFVKKVLSADCDALLSQGLSDREIIQKLTDKYVKNINTGLSKEYAQAALEMIELSAKIKGMFTVYGKHAAGVIISKDPLKTIAPLRYDDSDQVMTTQCSPAQAEEKGLLKMDFLGLQNLDIITDIMRTPGKEDYELMRVITETDQDGTILDNPDIYKELLHTGLTQGIFQCESPGFKKLMQNFQPDTYEDMILLLAVFRPGPMDYIPEIIAQKWYRKDPDHYIERISKIYPKDNEQYKHLYPVPQSSISLKNETLDKILAPTYGCPVYQEQIMEIFRAMAGYSLGGADVVRRYMSKKKVDKLAYEKETFVNGDPKRGIPGCVKLHGVTKEEAENLFEQMMPFAKYGFNKSHAAAYAKIAVITAYQKHHDPIEFYRCSMNAMDSIKKVTPYIKEAKKFGINVLPPSIMKSENDFVCETDKALRYGFSFIKGIGSLDITYRTTSMYEFICNNPGVTLANVKALAQVGCFDKLYEFGDAELDKKQELFSRQEMVDFATSHFKDINAYVTAKKEVESIQSELQAATQLGDEDRILNLQQSLTVTQDAVTKYENKIVGIPDEVREATENLKPLTSKQEVERIAEYIELEKELIAYMPACMRAVDRLDDKKFSNKDFDYYNTFEQLKNASCEKVRVRAAVLNDGSDKTYYTQPKVDKNGKTVNGKPYRLVSLIDTNGTIVQRRFKAPVSVQEAWFDLYVDDKKFFIHTEKDVNTEPKAVNQNNQPRTVQVNEIQPEIVCTMQNTDSSFLMDDEQYEY